ncbi:MAG: hypothetical protein WDO14_13230 [Bacteroidota bacterium]
MTPIFFNIIVALAILQPDNGTTIRIDHVGVSDKPVPSLCMSVSLANCNESAFDKSIVVSKDEIQAIEKFVSDKKVSTEFNAQSAYEMGSFKITVRKNSIIDISYVLDERKKSINYLNALLKDLSSSNNSKLQDELQNILKRIDY